MNLYFMEREKHSEMVEILNRKVKGRKEEITIAEPLNSSDNYANLQVNNFCAISPWIF